MINYNMFLNYETFNMELSCADWQQEWHVTAIPDEIWDSVPQEVLTHLLFFYMDYHRHLERLKEERLEALRQQERIIRLAILFVESRKKELFIFFFLFFFIISLALLLELGQRLLTLGLAA